MCVCVQPLDDSDSYDGELDLDEMIDLPSDADRTTYVKVTIDIGLHLCGTLSAVKSDFCQISLVIYARRLRGESPPRTRDS